MGGCDQPLFFVQAVGNDKARPARFSQAWLYGRLILTESEHSAQMLTRTRRHCEASVETLAVSIHRYGGCHVEIDERPAEHFAGAVNVMDFSRPHRSVLKGSRHRSLIVAHDLVGYDPGRHPAAISFSCDGAIGRVLERTINTIFDTLDRTTSAQAETLSNGLVALLRNVLFSDPVTAQSSSDFTAARIRAIRAHVDETVSKQLLTADSISSRFNVSRSTLYRDFKDEGGFERFVVGRKLEAALTELAFAPAERGAVTRVAERLGFTSVAHFSRAFRSRFGFAPSEILGAGVQSQMTSARERTGDVGNHANTLRGFLKNL